jgi:hypothetical protein
LVFRIIKLIGAAYLIYLGITLILASKDTDVLNKNNLSANSLWKIYRQDSSEKHILDSLHKQNFRWHFCWAWLYPICFSLAADSFFSEVANFYTQIRGLIKGAVDPVAESA